MHLGGRALKQVSAVIHHHDPVGNVHDQIHVVLDKNDGHSAAAKHAYTVEQTVHFGGVQACRRLVDEQKMRLGGKRTRELEHALLAIRQSPSDRMHARGHAGKFKQSYCLIMAASLIFRESRGVDHILPGRNLVMDMKSRDHVVQHAELLEQTYLLERARDTEPHAAMRGHPGKIQPFERKQSGIWLDKRHLSN